MLQKSFFYSIFEKATFTKYQLKKLADYFFTLSQVIIGSSLVKLLEPGVEIKFDIRLTAMLLLFSIVASVILFRLAVTVAGKVKD